MTASGRPWYGSSIGVPNITCSYDSEKAACQEVADARVWLGYTSVPQTSVVLEWVNRSRTGRSITTSVR